MIEIEFDWLILALMSMGLASVHLWSTWFDVRYARREPFWMGLIGGIAAGYVVLYMLPKIARVAAPDMIFTPGAGDAFLELQLYLLMLLAMVMYLLMLHLDTRKTRWAYLAHAFDYLVHGSYSLLLGYVFIELASDRPELNGIICLIFALHLLGMNHVLRKLRTSGFDSTARWIYFLLVLIGAALGLTTELPKPFVYAVTAFLAGIILVFVISEELPIRHQNRMPSFLLGIGLFVGSAYLIISLDPRPSL